MNALTITGAINLTMSSREIAELCEKEHKHVMRDIKVMFEQLGELEQGYVQNWTNPQNGQIYPCFSLPKDLTLTLVAGYNVKLRKRIIDRWLELEAKVGAGGTALNPANLSRLQLIEMAMQAEQERLALESKVQEQAPKVEGFDRIAKADGSLCFTDAAKTLQMRLKDLIAWLSSHKWIYQRSGTSWIGYQDKIQAGHVEHKTTTVERSDGTEKVVTQARITPKGLTRLAEMLSGKDAKAA